MGRCLIKIKDKYFEWSTIVDAPITIGMSKSELEKHIKEEYGNEGLKGLPERLERVSKTGTSSLIPGENLESLISENRAGENESHISADEIYEKCN